MSSCRSGLKEDGVKPSLFSFVVAPKSDDIIIIIIADLWRESRIPQSRETMRARFFHTNMTRAADVTMTPPPRQCWLYPSMVVSTILMHASKTETKLHHEETVSSSIQRVISIILRDSTAGRSRDTLLVLLGRDDTIIGQTNQLE